MVNPNQVPKVKLNNGLEIPVFGLGTWKSKPGEVTQAVKDAIDAGYRHIDCAWVYGNEKEVGEAIKAKIDEKVVKREDLFIVSKLWCTFHKPEAVEPALKQSLTALGLDYLDLYLMHAPMDFKPGDDGSYQKDENGHVVPEGVDYVDTWKAMEEVYKKGLVKSIGISNFNRKQIERLLQLTTVVPVTNQVECHPYLNQKKLAEFCKSKEITITAYSPFGAPDRPWAKPDDPKLLDDGKLKIIGDKYKKTHAQVIIRYLLQRGLIAIPKSVNKKRIQENIDVFDFQLTSEDVKYIDSFDCNGRIILWQWFTTHPHYPFNDEY
ncbi:aldose reductase [Agrilus planipennis]|uniref:Aldose reductase n=1 Tax=Agrilus planipennis TaxID=224129 RepID=A0A1W4XDC3_AGRPL|nr:aldose reductase [Agrilus planipennis]